MKTSKALLGIFFVLFIILLSSWLVAYCISLITGIVLWPFFILCIISQFVGRKAWDRFIEVQSIKTQVDQLLAKPYKEYIVSLPCQHCSTLQPVTVDLDDDTFNCKHCGKDNVVLTEFKTAAKIAEINEQDIFSRMSKIGAL